MDPDNVKRQIAAVDDQIHQLQKERERANFRHEAAIKDASQRAEAAENTMEENPAAERVRNDFTTKLEMETTQKEKDEQSFDAKIADLMNQKSALENDLRAAEEQKEKLNKLQQAEEVARQLYDENR